MVRLLYGVHQLEPVHTPERTGGRRNSRNDLPIGSIQGQKYSFSMKSHDVACRTPTSYGRLFGQQRFPLGSLCDEGASFDVS